MSIFFCFVILSSFLLLCCPFLLLCRYALSLFLHRFALSSRCKRSKYWFFSCFFLSLRARYLHSALSNHGGEGTHTRPRGILCRFLLETFFPLGSLHALEDHFLWCTLEALAERAWSLNGLHFGCTLGKIGVWKTGSRPARGGLFTQSLAENRLCLCRFPFFYPSELALGLARVTVRPEDLGRCSSGRTGSQDCILWSLCLGRCLGTLEHPHEHATEHTENRKFTKHT